MIETETLAVLRSVAPGYVGLFIFRFIRPGGRVSWGETLVSSLVYSLAGFALSETLSSALGLAEGVNLLLQMVFCGVIGLGLGLFTRSKKGIALIERVTGMNPAHDTWQYAMEAIVDEWVRVEMQNGATYDGKVKSYSVGASGNRELVIADYILYSEAGGDEHLVADEEGRYACLTLTDKVTVVRIGPHPPTPRERPATIGKPA